MRRDTADMTGIVPSLNTPFDRQGDLDHGALRRLIDHTVEAGCGGMLGLAVAGEHHLLTHEEKRAFIATAAKANAGRIPLIISVTAPDAGTSRGLAISARHAGADGICVQLPTDLPLKDQSAFLHDLAEVGPDMLMVQDLDWAGGGLALDTITTLFEQIEKFTWLKIETQAAGPKYSAVREATGGALKVCGGWAVTQLMDAMARGVNAFIPTGMEQIYVAIHRHHETGDVNAARALFERLLPVLNFSNQHIDTSIRFFKQLRQAEGVFDTDTCRIPTGRFDVVQQAEARNALKTAMRLMAEVGQTSRTPKGNLGGHD